MITKNSSPKGYPIHESAPREKAQTGASSKKSMKQPTKGEEVLLKPIKTLGDSRWLSAGSWIGIFFGFLAFAFFFPRLLIYYLGAESPWTSYFYTYGFGFFYTGIGLLWSLRAESCQLHLKTDRQWFKAIILGWMGLAGVHALWIFLALSTPFKGDTP